MSLNKWIGIGNLGRDAELRYTADGTAVANFSIACNETWTDKSGQRQERVDWVRCAYWGKPAEAVAQYLTKGSQVYIEGRLKTRKWQGQDGQDRYTTEIHADEMKMLSKREGGGGGPPPVGSAEKPAGAPSSGPESDDIPF